ncbi:ATP-binding cassette domain-containing protein [Pedobacter helvus]|uniref:ATP-binding cassette domain-containing protein n=1 Tax=Pedobacter helvus TaxID=2563444 RepID=A0ABW9JF28_9SPHI|nr:ABC transporter ATP-binding protein [Pedobacter ureilyticus]
MLTIQDLSFAINNSFILSEVNLELNKGECICLFGKNGSGKSTLLKCISGIYTFKGKINLDGFNQEQRAEYFGNLGFFFPDSLYDFLTVKENYIVFLSYYGIKRSDVGKCMNDFVNAFELNDLLNAKLKTLSAGQKQRVELALAFMHQPKLILFDEPLNNLDIYFIDKFYSALNNYLLKHKASAIIVNHDVTSTPAWINKIGIIEDKFVKTTDNNKQGLDYIAAKIYQK